MEEKLQKETVLITGASSGIGEATAYQLAKNGKNLILIARRYEKLKEVKEKCEKIGGNKCLIFRIDLSNLRQIDQLIDFIEEKNIEIDVLINNAGFGHIGPFIEMDYIKVEKLFKVNVLALMYLTQNIALRMLNKKSGKIINIASLAGEVATSDFAVYAATKAAIIAFTNALRLELENQGIQVSLINFGPVKSPFFNKVSGPRKEISKNSFFAIETEKAASYVVKSVQKDIREINRPILLNLGAKLYNIAPAIIDKILLTYFKQ